MFSNKNKAKVKTKRPVPGGPAPVSTQNKKGIEKARAVNAVAAKDKAADAPERSATTTSSLNPHLFFEGNLKFTGTVLIDCDFRGTIETDDTLVVGIAGNVQAEVTAGVIEISGAVHGNIKASTSVKVFSGGEVHGNIETPTISMEEGVIFEGNCTRPGMSKPVAETLQKALGEAPPLTSSSQDGSRRKVVVTENELADMR